MTLLTVTPLQTEFVVHKYTIYKLLTFKFTSNKAS